MDDEGREGGRRAAASRDAGLARRVVAPFRGVWSRFRHPCRIKVEPSVWLSAPLSLPLSLSRFLRMCFPCITSANSMHVRVCVHGWMDGCMYCIRGLCCILAWQRAVSPCKLLCVACALFASWLLQPQQKTARSVFRL